MYSLEEDFSAGRWTEAINQAKEIKIALLKKKEEIRIDIGSTDGYKVVADSIHEVIEKS